VSLRARLLAAATLLVVSLGVSGFLIIRTVERSAVHQIDNQLMANVPISAGIVGDTPPLDSTPPPVARANVLSDSYLAVISDGVRTTLAFPQAAKGQEPHTPPTVAASIGAGHPSTVKSEQGSGRWRAILVQTPTSRQLLVAVYMGSVDATTSQLKAAVFAVDAVMALILVVAGFWVERLGLRPIASMKRVAEAIIAGDRKRRVATGSSRAETADLAGALNSMLDQQNAIEERLRQFVADASHELRTPTSVISGLAQLWRQGDLREGPNLQDAMRRIGQESARMRVLVEELLLLARLDEGKPLHTETVDLAGVVQDVVQSGTATHPSRQIQLELDPNVTIPGEPEAIHRLTSNLVNNALTHTPPTSPVTVRLTRTPSQALLQVTDGGPGMNPADAAHAFDRFWRAESSRTRAGSGLGLSIAQAIVTAHHGEIDLHTDLRHGTTLSVRLPREPVARDPADTKNSRSGLVDGQ